MFLSTLCTEGINRGKLTTVHVTAVSFNLTTPLVPFLETDGTCVVGVVALLGRHFYRTFNNTAFCIK